MDTNTAKHAAKVYVELCNVSPEDRDEILFKLLLKERMEKDRPVEPILELTQSVTVEVRSNIEGDIIETSDEELSLKIKENIENQLNTAFPHPVITESICFAVKKHKIQELGLYTLSIHYMNRLTGEIKPVRVKVWIVPLAD